MIGIGNTIWNPALGGAAAAAPVTHTITASAGAHGSISPSGAVSVEHGANQQFAFTADSGYEVTSLTVDGSPASTTSPYTFSNVSDDHTIVVAFALSETIVRTARGTFSASGQGDIVEVSVPGVNVTAGAWLLVGLAYNDDGGEAVVTSMTLAGVSFVEYVSTGYAGDRRCLRLWAARFASAVSNGTLFIDLSHGYSPSAVVGVLTQVAGLATSSVLDVYTGATDDSGTSPSSGATAAPAQAHEFVWGLIATDGPEADAAGTWTNNLTAGQRIGESSEGEPVTISEGYRVATVQAAQTASKTGTTNRAWAAFCATFKAGA